LTQFNVTHGIRQVSNIDIHTNLDANLVCGAVKNHLINLDLTPNASVRPRINNQRYDFCNPKQGNSWLTFCRT